MLFLSGFINFCSASNLLWSFLWSLMKEIKKKLKSPLFYFHCNCGKVCPTDSDLFGLSRSTRCGCDRKHYCKHCEVWSEFNIFCTLVTMATAVILNLFNPQRCHTLRWIFLQSFICRSCNGNKKVGILIFFYFFHQTS
jgi:hypothetical protein